MRFSLDYVEGLKSAQFAFVCVGTPSGIEGEADMRTPSGAGGEQMFRGLKFRKVPTAMVQFPGETHELSRSGKPRHRVERWQHIVAWFDKYLQGQEIRTYDP